MRNKLSQSVAGILFSQDKREVLLIERKDIPVWVLPGGGIEKGETPEEAVCREVEEETGLQVTITRKVAEYSPLCRLARYTYFFECQAIGGSIRTGAETRTIRFFPIDSLPKRMPPPYREWIGDALLSFHTTIKKKIGSVTYFALLRSLCTHPILVVRFLLTRIGIRFQ